MTRISKKANVLLWTAQIALALLFVFAGATKVLAPAAELEQGPMFLSAAFLRFIGVAEVFGAFGLILPGLFRTHRYLTPLAAAGLTIIMTGATILTALTMSVIGAIVPLIVGSLAVTIFIRRGGVSIVLPSLIARRPHVLREA
jgi:hypothetical protein